MVVAAGREEGRLRPVARLLLEAEDAAVERERALEVGDLQVHVADVHSRSMVRPRSSVSSPRAASDSPRRHVERVRRGDRSSSCARTRTSSAPSSGRVRPCPSWTPTEPMGSRDGRRRRDRNRRAATAWAADRAGLTAVAFAPNQRARRSSSGSTRSARRSGSSGQISTRRRSTGKPAADEDDLPFFEDGAEPRSTRLRDDRARGPRRAVRASCDRGFPSSNGARALLEAASPGPANARLRPWPVASARAAGSRLRAHP